MKKEKKVVKGMPTAVLVSILIHGGLFLLAGMFVVFTVVKQKEVEFAPPKAVERPKMKLKKPKVKVKKSSKPKPTTRIVTKVTRASMPDIQLPEMSGMAEGLSGGDIGFDLMPDLDTVSVFGSGQSIGNDLEGTLYDFKRRRDGTPPTVQIGQGDFYRYVEKFIKSGWKVSTLSRFYHSPNKLYTPTIMVSGVPSILGPWAFNEPDVAGYFYMLHYKGTLFCPVTHTNGITFRFWGMGDNFMVIRVDGKVVFDFGNQFDQAWSGPASMRSPYHMAYWPAFYGQWIHLEPGAPKELEIIFGEYTGGLTAAMLCVEEKGVKYPKNFENGPMLPVFKTAELTRDQVDAIYEYLNDDHYCVTNGPVFSDYAVPKKVQPPVGEAAAKVEPSVADGSKQTKMRTWTLNNGKSVEAELVLQMGDKAVLKNARGKQVKVPLSELSAGDLDYLELASPPPLKITFLKELERFKFEIIPLMSDMPVFTKFTGGVKIEKTNKKPYTKKLKVELFTIASEMDGNNYILMDRVEGEFTPSKENGERFELWGNGFYLRDYQDGAGYRRGERLKGHMVVITDERGIVVAKDVSNDWMFDIIDFLREFPVGRHFSKAGERVYPPRAEINSIYWDAIIAAP